MPKTKPPTPARKAAPQQKDCPWTDVDEAGSELTIDSFITTQMSRVGNALRRAITVPYADQVGLTVAEWRMLSVLAEARELPFARLVALSATDKSLVSRALRLLEARNLVSIQAEPGAPRKGLTCRITNTGLRMYDKVMPMARQRQAAMLRVLTRAEREVMYRALRKLHGHCLQDDDGTLEA